VAAEAIGADVVEEEAVTVVAGVLAVSAEEAPAVAVPAETIEETNVRQSCCKEGRARFGRR